MIPGLSAFAEAAESPGGAPASRPATAGAVARTLLLGLALLAAPGPAFAQAASGGASSTAPGAATGSASDTTKDGAMSDLESDFFGDEAGQAKENEQSKIQEQYAEDLLKREPVRIGGDFDFEIKAGAGWKRDFADWDAAYLRDHGVENSAVDLKGSLFFSARPTDRVRYYGKAKIEYPFANTAASAGDLTAATDNDPKTLRGSGINVPNISIWELFTDVDISNKVFVRAGKQMVKWGVGYFFQPADVISLSPVDVLDPTAEREGPVAIKANLPFGKNNLDLYAIAPADETIDSIKKVGVAGRVQYVVGGWELGAGAAYQKTADWQFVGTASGSVGKLALFGEGLVKRKSPYNYLESSDPFTQNSTTLTHTVLAGRGDWFFDGTGGVMYVNSDAYLTLVGQYYFNGEGYEDARKVAPDVPHYLGTGQLGLGDILRYTGMHYLGLGATWTVKKDSDWSLGLTAIVNLSDGSGMIYPAVSYNFTDEIKLGVNMTFEYGRTNTQYRGLSGLGESYLLPVAAVQATLSIGTGKF